MNQLEVQIMGQSYILGCPVGAEERFHAAVKRVDDAMCKIRDAGKIKARDRIAVLAALNLAFDTPAKPASPAHLALDEQADPEGKMRQLLARLDQVLGDDGRLL